MSQFLVELYVPETIADRGALAALARKGESGTTRYLGSIFLPGDETCFHRFESPDAETLRSALERGGVPFERLTEAVVLS